MRVAVVGASGMVGRMFLKVLEEKKLNIDEYVLFSSANSAGQKVNVCSLFAVTLELSSIHLCLQQTCIFRI